MSDIQVWQAAHHKSGTVIVRKILWAMAGHFGLKTGRRVGNHEIYRRFGPFDSPVFDRGEFHNDLNVLLDNHSRIPVPRGAQIRGIHVVRSPREIIRSGVVYHQVTNEPWASLPRKEFGGVSYRTFLSSQSPEKQTLTEIEWSSVTLEAILDWDYEDSRFLNIRFEELIEPSLQMWNTVLLHLFPNSSAVQRFLLVQLRSKRLERMRDLFKPVPSRHFSKNIGKKPDWSDTAEQALNAVIGERKWPFPY